MRRGIVAVGLVFVGLLFLLLFGTRLYQVVPPGHVAVATFFGKVQPEPYAEGIHVPVNPFYNWYIYDIREKSHKETANIPSQDQLQTSVDVSVQYRLRGRDASRILQETGLAQDVVAVHMVPKLRSLLREQGKSVKRAEDFFQEETQTALQSTLLDGLRSYLEPKGVDVQAVLIRDIRLPDFIVKAIEAKKEREQAVEKQRAELERFRTEQQQTIAAAEAQRKAAEEQATRQRVLADARAYEIERLNAALAGNTGYIQLQALEALQAIAKDPAAKLYFVNGESPSPLPLMHLGDRIGQP
jgi:regulator of protease activity HflC (stomatin/prohibitin superfamily)